MAGPVLGTALEPLELLVERRMLYKLLNIMDNTTHSLRIPLARLHYTHTHLTSHWTDYTTHTHTHTQTDRHSCLSPQDQYISDISSVSRMCFVKKEIASYTSKHSSLS